MTERTYRAVPPLGPRRELYDADGCIRLLEAILTGGTTHKDKGIPIEDRLKWMKKRMPKTTLLFIDNGYVSTDIILSGSLGDRRRSIKRISNHT